MNSQKQIKVIFVNSEASTGAGGEANGPVEKFSRDKICFKEVKEAFQNAEHMNRSGKMLWHQRDTGML